MRIICEANLFPNKADNIGDDSTEHQKLETKSIIIKEQFQPI